MKRILLSILFIVSSLAVWAQSNDETTRIYARPYGDSIALRWHPYNIPLWERNIVKGYDIYRKGENGLVIKLNDSTVRAFNEHQFMHRYIKYPEALDSTKDESLKPEDFKYFPDTSAIKAYTLMYPEKVGLKFNLPGKDAEVYFGDDPLTVRWLFHSITCLTSKEAAIISGLYFVDKKIIKGERYTYYITTAGTDWTKALATITVASNDSYPIHAPMGITDFTNKQHAHISWKKADTANVFIPSYEIYRSDKKNGTYIRLNKKPILAIQSGANQRDSTVSFYADSTIKKKQTYFYKIRAKDVFGDYSPFSEPYSVTDKTFLEVSPVITEIKKMANPFAVSLKWYIDPVEEENIASVHVYRSKLPDTLFTPLGESLKLNQREYLDKKPTKNNYYKIVTIGKAGDTLWSSPAYMLIPDSIPPAPAKITYAKCDSNGIVTIQWENSKDEDLNSFKIYRANYKGEEFSRIATIEKIDSVYTDTISLATLTKSVFYKIIAYDDSYNPSEFSNVMEAKRYDTIVPTHPVFTTLRSDSIGIQLRWANSSSEDVVKTILYRRLRGESAWHEYKVFPRDTAVYSSFIDSDTYKGRWYEYALESFDDSRNRSGFSPVVQLRAFEDGFRPPIKDITVKSNTRKRMVKISWVYNEPGIQRIQIYRGENDKPVTILKSLESGTIEFYDNEVTSGKKYIYKIRIIFKDGASTPFSKDIEVKL